MRIFHRLVDSTILTGQALVAAFQFLSRIPIPVSVPFNGEVCRRSLLYFPFVGWTLGIMLWLASWGVSSLFPPFVSAVLIVILWTAFSGGLHLDGWMDTADGMLSHRSKERMLEIMRDSRVGAMGAIAAVFALLIKTAVLASMLAEGVDLFAFMIVIIPAFSRLSMVWAIAKWPYVRKSGIGSLYQGTTSAHAIGASAIMIIFAGVMPLFMQTEWSLLLRDFAILFIVTWIASSLICILFTRKLDGMTGDTYGCLNETIEMLLLLVTWVLVMHI